jgi:hypothetical protein
MCPVLKNIFNSKNQDSVSVTVFAVAGIVSHILIFCRYKLFLSLCDCRWKSSHYVIPTGKHYLVVFSLRCLFWQFAPYLLPTSKHHLAGFGLCRPGTKDSALCNPYWCRIWVICQHFTTNWHLRAHFWAYLTPRSDFSRKKWIFDKKIWYLREKSLKPWRKTLKPWAKTLKPWTKTLKPLTKTLKPWAKPLKPWLWAE